MQGDRCYAIHAPYPHFDVEYEFPVRPLENPQVNWMYIGQVRILLFYWF